jgi:predicted aspartyl protease
MVQGRIEGVLADWKIDTGAKSTFITKEAFDLIVDKPVFRPVVNTYVTANGQIL